MSSAFKYLLPAAALVTALAMPASAAEPFGPGTGEISGTVGVVSQYVFRGLAQTDEHPAVQASIDYTHDSGFYAGVWGSNIDFQDDDEGQLETDIYAGWSGEFSDIAWDIGAIYYWYPGADNDLNYDYYELAVSAGYDFDFANVSVAVNYSPDYFADSGDAWYLAGNVEVPLPADFKLTGHVGHQYIDDNDNFGSPDYTDWSVGVGYNLYGFDLSVNYIDTDLDDGDECVKGWCDERVVFGVSRSF